MKHSALLIAVSKNNISVLQGIVQAVGHMASRVGVAWIVAPFAFLLSKTITGIGSECLGGSARIPFVAGLDYYMPSWMGEMFIRNTQRHTPHGSCTRWCRWCW